MYMQAVERQMHMPSYASDNKDSVHTHTPLSKLISHTPACYSIYFIFQKSVSWCSVQETIYSDKSYHRPGHFHVLYIYSSVLPRLAGKLSQKKMERRAINTRSRTTLHQRPPPPLSVVIHMYGNSRQQTWLTIRITRFTKNSFDFIVGNKTKDEK